MTQRGVETMIPFHFNRATANPTTMAQFAQKLGDSGVVDYFQAYDQLVSWWPRVLWTPDNAPLAEVMPDLDSFADAFLLSGWASAAAPSLGTAISSDGLRRGPAELMQTMMTLGTATEKDAILKIGAGELKQARPYSYKRSEGLARLEDMFAIFRLLSERDDPFDYDGNVLKFRNAWIGAIRPSVPKFWALGGGPKLLGIAARYADGYSTAIPFAYHDVESYAADVAKIKNLLEQNGRDPDDFAFGIWAVALISEDPSFIDATLDNPLMKFLAAIMGRSNQVDWEKDGFEPIFPPDWHYSTKLLPLDLSLSDANAIVSKVPRAKVEKSMFTGTPKEVASQVQAFVDAGATHVSVFNFLPLMLPFEQAAQGIDMDIEVCRLLKAHA